MLVQRRLSLILTQFYLMLLYLEFFSNLLYFLQRFLLQKLSNQMILEIVGFECLSVKTWGCGEHSVRILTIYYILSWLRNNTTCVRSKVGTIRKRCQYFCLVRHNKLVIIMLVNCVCFQCTVERTINLLDLRLQLYSQILFVFLTILLSFYKSTLMSYWQNISWLYEIRLWQKIYYLLLTLRLSIAPYLRCYQHLLIVGIIGNYMLFGQLSYLI